MNIRYVFLFMFFTSVSYCQSLLVEDFNYSANTDMSSNGWTVIGTNQAGNNNVAYQGLTLSGYNATGIGLADTIVGASSRDEVGKSFTTQSSGSVYYSFLLNVAVLPATEGYFTGIQAAVGSTYNTRLYIKKNGSSYNIGIGTAGTGTYAVTPTLLSTGTVYLVVVKYEIVSGAANDVVRVFLFSSAPPGTEPGSSEVSITMGTDFNPGAIYIRQDASALSGLLDGIRVATAWSHAPLPVELTTFSSNTINGKVKLNWSTATEVNNNGFDVQRSTDQNTWKSIGFVAGAGNSNNTHNYSYTDNSVQIGTYYYRLKQVDNDGTFSYNNAIEVKIGTPENFSLEQNYPNPFNPGTVISYSIPQTAKVELQVYSLTGQLVKTLVNETKEAGYYTASFNGAGLSSGLYIYQLKAGNVVQTRKMTLLK